MKMTPHFGKLAGGADTADEARRERPDDQARDEVANQRRQVHFSGYIAANKSGDNRHRDGGKQR
jgi:hypothetical protein